MRPDPNKRTLLIIDDERPLVEMLAKFFIAEGYEVVTAFDGEDGLRKAEQVNPHLILLDINMPKSGGIDFYSHVCGKDLKSKYPVLVMTGRSHMEELFKDLNADGFLAKPFRMDELARKVSAIIKKHYGEFPEPKPVEREIKMHEKGQKILVVEDDTKVLEGIVTLFLNHGYTVTAVKCGAEVIPKVQADMPDLIVLKVPLPDLPGDIVAFKVKQTPDIKHIPIMLYIPRSNRLVYNVTEQICKKIGLRDPLETDDPLALLKECELVLKYRFSI